MGPDDLEKPESQYVYVDMNHSPSQTTKHQDTEKARRKFVKQEKASERNPDDPQKQNHDNQKGPGGGETEEHTIIHEPTKDPHEKKKEKKEVKEAVRKDQMIKTWSKDHEPQGRANQKKHQLKKQKWTTNKQ